MEAACSSEMLAHLTTTQYTPKIRTITTVKIETLYMPLLVFNYENSTTAKHKKGKAIPGQAHTGPGV